MRPTHGSYVVAGRRYLNKLRAVTDAVRMGHWIHWDFHDREFGAYDWSKEPDKSLDQLYVERARNLRERYEHIAIEFSGGSDSWNALYSFVRAGLKVDTVIHKYHKRTVKGWNDRSPENRWAEGDFQAWPAFQRLKQIDPSLKWFTWEMEDDILKGWNSNRVDILFHNNLHPGAVLKSPDLGNINPAGIPDKPTTALITGVDKPIIELIDNKFYMVFYDYALIPRAFYEKEALGVPMHDILFYWDPDCCDLIAKQAHVIVKYLKQHPEMCKILSVGRGHKRDACYALFNQLVYPEYKAEWNPEKPCHIIAMEHESWFWKDRNDHSVMVWKNLINDYSAYVRDLLTGSAYQHFLVKDGNSDIDTLPACPSKRYFIADLYD